MRNNRSGAASKTQNFFINAQRNSQTSSSSLPATAAELEIRKSWFYLGSANLSPSAW
jgi:hypothetical protein